MTFPRTACATDPQMPVAAGPSFRYPANIPCAVIVVTRGAEALAGACNAPAVSRPPTTGDVFRAPTRSSTKRPAPGCRRSGGAGVCAVPDWPVPEPAHPGSTCCPAHCPASGRARRCGSVSRAGTACFSSFVLQVYGQSGGGPVPRGGATKLLWAVCMALSSYGANGRYRAGFVSARRSVRFLHRCRTAHFSPI